LKIPVVDLQYTSNTAKLEANSNVVTEFSRSKKLIKYPRVAMTANDNSGTSGYVADQTNTASHGNADAYAYRLFDNTSEGYQSGTAYSSGNPTASAPTTTASDGSTHQGVAITLDLVTKIRLDHVVITSHANYGRTPVDGTFLGSHNSSTWDVIGTFTGLSTFADNQKHTITITNSSQKLAYRYIRFVVTKTHNSSVYNGGSLLEFRKTEYYGVPEYDPDAHGTDVTVKSYPNVPNTDWLEVYYDAKNYSGSGDVQDESGNDRDGTLYGNPGLNSADGIHKFDFDGAGDYIVRTGIPTPTGAGSFTHTVSMWFKVPSLATAVLLWGLAGEPDGTDGTPSGSDVPHAAIGTNGLISWAFWANDVSNQTAVDINRWYHCVWTYSGGTNGRGMFLDGVEQVLGAQTTALNMPNSTSRLVIGIYPHNLASNPFNGSIANFRLFNRALTSDEIYQLYAYQKEYFGHGDLSMTLKAGRLGIGTSEPRAMLDVRGDFYAPGTIVQVEQSIKRDDSSTSGTSASDIPGLSVTIHPKFGTSKILVSYQINMGGNYHMFLRVKRTQNGTTTYIGLGDANGNRPRATSYQSHFGVQTVEFLGTEILDPTNGMDPITYQVQFWVANAAYAAWINRSYDNYNNQYGPGCLSSSITVKEVCQ
jgi:hypothetical protein